MTPCSVCGSAACLLLSPGHCRTLNRLREPAKPKGRPKREEREELPPVDF